MTQYLILHKVRGEPAFDIAEPIDIGDEEGWIIPTSGHRAYPAWAVPLNTLPICQATELPEGLPDHYQPIDLPARKGMGLGIDMSKILEGLMPKFKRRI